ncbi:hypothetical protein [Bordetella genomosp. 11]|uniref:Uncharacterized protein n=1 Tax=Bordetella genomosp. 11 TaxID=1416808 RepID=A0A261UJN7_9BORD|nr:hypothetical protein [Bordetella genomosp. 11]OZI61592.1 hypothetical protein CAL28_20125 [Bordetella genomosp. 11]
MNDLNFRDMLETELTEMKHIRERVRAGLLRMFPVNSRVEVKLKHGQVKWTPATVTGASIDGGHYGYWGYVVVEIDTAKERSRQRFRSIEYKSVRLIGSKQ